MQFSGLLHAARWALAAVLVSCRVDVANAHDALDGSPSTQSSRTTYSIEYQVRIAERNPTVARVRWELAGIDEIRRIRLTLREDRFYDFSGTGSLERRGNDLIWTPGSPYAHLEYKARLRTRHGATKGFDSYSTSEWVITRAQALFPATHVTFKTGIVPEPRSRSRVLFFLQPGWRSYSAMEEISPGVFQADRGHQRLDRPTGWLALGRLGVAERTIGGIRVVIAKAPGSSFDAQGALDLYSRTLPRLSELLRFRPARILVVSGPDPMWRGGLSGESSFFLHGDRPIRTPDRTSPLLHELFHLLARFHPAADAHWLSEGLAEIYSLELQHRVGLLDDAGFRRGLRFFAEYGLWHVNLTAQADNAATNNSAPLVIWAIDHAIRRMTDGRRSLDDVVQELSGRQGRLSTADFLRTVNSVAGRNFTPFFQRHVYAGEPPGDFDLSRASSAFPQSQLEHPTKNHPPLPE